MIQSAPARVFVLAIVLLSQMVVLWLLTRESWLEALLVHFGAMGMLAGFRPSLGEKERLLLLLTIFGSLFGILAWLVVLIAGKFMAKFQPKTATTFNQWLEQFLDEEKPSEHLFRRLEAGQEDMSEKAMLQPFQDIMQYGTVSQKRHVLGHLTSHYSAAFAPILKIGLQDGENAVRVHAATAVARIEQRYTQQILTLSAKHRHHPDNPLYALELAEAYDEYAWCGVTDRQRTREMQRNAVSLLEDILPMQSQLSAEVREQMLTRLARLYVRLGEANKATDLLKPLLSEAPESTSASLLMWYWESLYATGRRDELRIACQATRHLLKKDSTQYHNAAGVLDMWLPATTTARAA